MGRRRKFYACMLLLLGQLLVGKGGRRGKDIERELASFFYTQAAGEIPGRFKMRSCHFFFLFFPGAMEGLVRSRSAPPFFLSSRSCSPFLLLHFTLFQAAEKNSAPFRPNPARRLPLISKEEEKVRSSGPEKGRRGFPFPFLLFLSGGRLRSVWQRWKKRRRKEEECLVSLGGVAFQLSLFVPGEADNRPRPKGQTLVQESEVMWHCS